MWCLIKGYIVWLLQTNILNGLVAFLSLDHEQIIWVIVNVKPSRLNVCVAICFLAFVWRGKS